MKSVCTFLQRLILFLRQYSYLEKSHLWWNVNTASTGNVLINFKCRLVHKMQLENRVKPNQIPYLISLLIFKHLISLLIFDLFTNIRTSYMFTNIRTSYHLTVLGLIFEQAHFTSFFTSGGYWQKCRLWLDAQFYQSLFDHANSCLSELG